LAPTPPTGAGLGRSVPGLDAISGPNGNLWFTETAVDRIGEITPKAADPVIREFTLPAGDHLARRGSPITSPTPSPPAPGDIWFTEQGSNAIGVMSTSGFWYTSSPSQRQSQPIPLGITEGADETMCSPRTTPPGRQYHRAGKVTVYPLPSAASGHRASSTGRR